MPFISQNNLQRTQFSNLGFEYEYHECKFQRAKFAIEQLDSRFALQYDCTYQRRLYHILELLCAALSAHLSHYLFLSVKINVIHSLLEFRFGEMLAKATKPATWHLLFALFWALLCNLFGEGTTI